MKKLLYITANAKPEPDSASKTVGAALVRALEERAPVQTETLDLYATRLPVPQPALLAGRNTLAGPEVVGTLPPADREDAACIQRLCDQFVAADWVVLAAPMWSLSFPAVVKQYLDCIILNGKTIAFTDEKPHGLLNDRDRSFVYVQASGGRLPLLLRPVLNKGLNYVSDMMRFMGVAHVYELLADGTGTTPEERRDALARAMQAIGPLVNAITGER